MKPDDRAKTPKGWAVPRTDRERALLTRRTFLFHLRPIKLSLKTLRWAHTFGLGGSSLVLWATLALSGILMLLVYQPVVFHYWIVPNSRGFSVGG